MKRIAETGECKKEEAPVPGRGLFLRASSAVNKTLYSLRLPACHWKRSAPQLPRTSLQSIK